MVIVLLLLGTLIQGMSAASGQLSARDCKEQIATHAVTCLQESSACLVRLGKEHKQMSGQCVSAIAKLQCTCIEIIDAIMDDSSFWHKATRTLLNSEIAAIKTQLEQAIKAFQHEKSIEKVSTVCVEGTMTLDTSCTVIRNSTISTNKKKRL